MMEVLKSLFLPEPNATQLLRGCQRRLSQECRNIDRQIRDIVKVEKIVLRSIKSAIKRKDMGAAKPLAKELVQSRKTVSRLYENKAQLNSISMRLAESVAVIRTVGHLEKSGEIMKTVNELMKYPETAVTMQELSKELTKAGVIEEIVNGTIEDALDSDDTEEETEKEVDKVLTEMASQIAAQLPVTFRKEKTKLSAQSAEEPIAESVDEEEEMEEIRARLAKVRML